MNEHRRYIFMHKSQSEILAFVLTPQLITAFNSTKPHLYRMMFFQHHLYHHTYPALVVLFIMIFNLCLILAQPASNMCIINKFHSFDKRGSNGASEHSLCKGTVAVAISSVQLLKSVTILLICILDTTTEWLQSMEAEGNTDDFDSKD